MGDFLGASGADCRSRLNGAGAGKVSVRQGQQRRKYHSCMEGRYLTPHSTLSSEKREGGAMLTQSEAEAVDVRGGRGQTEGGETCTE